MREGQEGKEGIPIQDLKSGQSCVVHQEGQEVAVFNVEGRLYGIGNRCPHRGGPLAWGHLETVLGTVAVRCPLHGWLFDLRTGRCLNQPQAKLPVYPESDLIP